MKFTENFKLKKPEQTDSYNVEDFNENADVVDAKLKELAALLTVKDISSDFVVGSSEGMGAMAVKVFKQGNVISGKMQLYIHADGAGDVECCLTINAKYKPAFSVPCHLYGSSPTLTKEYISISGNKIDYGETNTTEGFAEISFSYICQ